jgi:hypothetical protein
MIVPSLPFEYLELVDTGARVRTRRGGAVDARLRRPAPRRTTSG